MNVLPWPIALITSNRPPCACMRTLRAFVQPPLRGWQDFSLISGSRRGQRFEMRGVRMAHVPSITRRVGQL